MRFRYSVALPKEIAKLSLGRAILLFGSCFAEELYQQLRRELCPVAFSPFGISYNPLTIADSLERLLIKEAAVTEADLFYHLGEWHSLSHHSSFSHADKSKALQDMQESFIETQALLHTAQALCITWGTAYVYELKQPPQSVVNNCHKLPQNEYFQRRLLTPAEIAQRWIALIQNIQQRYPTLRLIFTISPIPHYRDGAQQNSISKSTLHLALHQLQSNVKEVEYFPAYEIMREELRDYRFYRPDFAHPTDEAVQYIIEQFKSCYLAIEEAPWLQAWQKVHTHFLHHPLSSNTETLRQHYSSVLSELQTFALEHSTHPYLQECLARTAEKLKEIEQRSTLNI